MMRDTERPAPSLDELIVEQTMERRVAPRRESMDALLRRLNADYVRTRDILNERCPRCESWLTDEARCLVCGRHSE